MPDFEPPTDQPTPSFLRMSMMNRDELTRAARQVLEESASAGVRSTMPHSTPQMKMMASAPQR